MVALRFLLVHWICSYTENGLIKLYQPVKPIRQMLSHNFANEPVAWHLNCVVKTALVHTINNCFFQI